MDFTFPDDKIIQFGLLKDCIIADNKLFIQPIDIKSPNKNIISINGNDYTFTYMDENGKNKGGNSIILKLFLIQNIDIEDVQYGRPDLVLKILKYKKAAKIFQETKSEKRFKKEIEALLRCNDQNFENIIKIYHYGICKIRSYNRAIYEEYLYYTMEFAEYDLRTYIESHHIILSLSEKLNLCLSLAQGLKQLFLLGYFHRDLKPDNIFIIGDIWKIGDLGLVAERDALYNIDEIAEPIGPRGWMSPESMNKHLSEGKEFNYPHNCKIDHQSDIFQLGKIFWYIFQHNAPIGSIKESDFYIKDNQIYAIIRTMLNHSKKKRFLSIDEVIKLLKKVENRFLKSSVNS